MFEANSSKHRYVDFSKHRSLGIPDITCMACKLEFWYHAMCENQISHVENQYQPVRYN